MAKETGEPDDATSIKSGSEGGWEKRPKGPRSQPTRLQSSSSTFSCVSFPSFFAFQEGMWDTQISALLSSPTVSVGFVRHSKCLSNKQELSSMQNFVLTIGKPSLAMGHQRHRPYIRPAKKSYSLLILLNIFILLPL
jgi:hypothetical protein